MKTAIAGGILFTLWLAGMLVFGSLKEIEPDISIDDDSPCKVAGHPLWSDC